MVNFIFDAILSANFEKFNQIIKSNEKYFNLFSDVSPAINRHLQYLHNTNIFSLKIVTNFNMYIRRFPKAREQFISEVETYYERGVKRAAIYAKLESPAERERLNIHAYPKPYPALVIRGPISWHTSAILAKHHLEHNLFTLNKVGFPVV